MKERLNTRNMCRKLTELLKHIYYLIKPKSIFIQRSSKAIGDNLLLTALLPGLKKKYPKHTIIVETNLPELFRNNPHVSFITELRWIRTKRHYRPKYYYDKTTTKHIVTQLLEFVGLEGFALPELYLTPEEIITAKKDFNFDYIAISPIGKQTFAANRKDWEFEHFQNIVNSLSSVKFVQIGSTRDRLLDNVIDARVHDLRKTAGIIKNAMFLICLEGGSMHLAQSIQQRSLTISTGFVKPQNNTYPNDRIIYHDVPCAPCGHSTAPHDFCKTKECTATITEAEVIGVITQMIDDFHRK